MGQRSPAEESLLASARAYRSWGLTENWSQRTANARNSFLNRFLDEAGGDVRRAEALKAAYFRQLAAKSAAARRRASHATSQAVAAEAELADLGGDAA